ncbi:hypothetical protein ACFWOG_20440 [Kitasatospora sp. NPDC058406]|uniref:hypothetical protein n=1 Tax=Kitasatospora sp. NPDC058406 TaxID=3346483 RepID=UPI0036685B27
MKIRTAVLSLALTATLLTGTAVALTAGPSGSRTAAAAPEGAEPLTRAVDPQLFADTGDGGRNTDDAVRQAADKKANRLPCIAKREVRNVRFKGTRTEWPNTAEWRVSGWGPHKTLRLDRKVSVANKTGSTFGLSNSVLSASVGFDVTLTQEVGISASAELTKKAHYQLQAGAVFKMYSYDVYYTPGEWLTSGMWGSCIPTGKKPYRAGSGTVGKFWIFDHRTVKV